MCCIFIGQKPHFVQKPKRLNLVCQFHRLVTVLLTVESIINTKKNCYLINLCRSYWTKLMTHYSLWVRFRSVKSNKPLKMSGEKNNDQILKLMQLSTHNEWLHKIPKKYGVMSAIHVRIFDDIKGASDHKMTFKNHHMHWIVRLILKWLFDQISLSWFRVLNEKKPIRSIILSRYKIYAYCLLSNDSINLFDFFPFYNICRWLR